MNMALRLVKGDQIVTVASTHIASVPATEFATPLNDDRFPSSRAMLRRKVIQIPDILAEDWSPRKARQRAEQRGYRAIMVAPMLRENKAIGAITVNRANARTVHRQAGRAAQDLRRPGGDRDRERAAVQRDEGERSSSRRRPARSSRQSAARRPTPSRCSTRS